MRASIPAKKGEFSAYRDRTTNRAPIRPSDHRRVVANQVQRIAAPTRIGYSNAHVSVILPYSGPWCAPVTFRDRTTNRLPFGQATTGEWWRTRCRE